MPLPSGPLTTRRAVLAVAAAGAVTAGCGRATTPAGDDEVPATDRDTVLATEAAALSGELLALVRAAGRGQPEVARRLAPLATLHRAHLGVLPEADPPARVGGVGADPVAAVLGREAAGARRVRGWALEAESGPLARLLASIAAGIAVHVEDLR